MCIYICSPSYQHNDFCGNTCTWAHMIYSHLLSTSRTEMFAWISFRASHLFNISRMVGDGFFARIYFRIS